ncbi:hypothetical protein L226DRAFT_572062 [Lentinus tigrinus ALCF2SS1-7]|uniref:uncharacterized protein n=1 Tax=Lentinus tigrinus ALCF2SS1-7 TaxID=1328758 RepID=UPI001165F7E7|nr:hypothetical protein L226DRAFT_572062 [Lentinus tigrinus ALCF2SS1-7]
MRMLGRAIVVGFAAGQVVKLALNLALCKNIQIVGIYWGAYTKIKPERVLVVWQAVLDTVSSDRLVPNERRKTWGKVIMSMREAVPMARM